MKAIRSDVAAERLVEELEPARAVRRLGRGDRRELGDALGRVGGPQLAGPEVDGAAGRAEQEGVAVPILRRHREGRVASGEPLDAGRELDLARPP